MANSGGGCFLPNEAQVYTGPQTFSSVTATTLTATTGTITTLASTAATLTNPTINGTAFATGQAPILVEKVAISGTAVHAGVVTAKTFSAAAIILRVCLNITTASTGASTLNIGYTATTATTNSDTLLDGVSGTPAALFDSMNAALDSGANAKAQLAAAAKWITVAEDTGDTTGLVGHLYIEYVLV